MVSSGEGLVTPPFFLPCGWSFSGLPNIRYRTPNVQSRIIYHQSAENITRTHRIAQNRHAPVQDSRPRIFLRTATSCSRPSARFFPGTATSCKRQPAWSIFVGFSRYGSTAELRYGNGAKFLYKLRMANALFDLPGVDYRLADFPSLSLFHVHSISHYRTGCKKKVILFALNIFIVFIKKYI